MILQFKINLKNAMAAGKNADSENCVLDVNPAELSPDDREILTAAMQGINCTGNFSHRGGTYRIELSEASIDSLKEELQRIQEECKQREAEAKESEENQRKHADKSIMSYLDDIKNTYASTNIHRDANGQPVDYYDAKKYVSLTVKTPSIPEKSYYYASGASEDMVKKLHAAHDAACAERNRLIAEADATEIPRLIAERKEEERLIEEAGKTTAAEYEKLYDRLPETLKQRHKDGYATEQEIERSLQFLIVEDAGLHPSPEMFEHLREQVKIKSLSDPQFKNLKLIQEKFSDCTAAAIEAKKVWESGYRPAEDDDDPDDIDSDNEVRCHVGERMAAVLTFQRAGLDFQITLPLTDDWRGCLKKS